MKIQDAISAYDFLAKLDWIGILGLTIAATVLIVFFVLSIVDKLFDDKKVKRSITALTVISIILCICILKYEADRNNDLLYRANDIKQYMLENNESSSGFIELATNVNFPDIKPVPERVNEIKHIISHFPDEFAETVINYPNFKNDNDGIILINTKTLQIFNSKNERLCPLYKGEILNFMKGKHWDTLNYKYIREIIDDRCSDNVLDMLVSKNPNLFIAVYAPHNVYEQRDKQNSVGVTYALKISDDSVARILRSGKK